MLTGVHNLDQATMKHMLRFVIQTGANMMIFGNAGTGKTEMAMQATHEMNMRFVYLNLSVLEAPDLVGLPVVDHETNTSTYASPKMLPLYDENQQKVVLLVDEIDKAKPELQNPMLEMFQFRSMNGRKLNIHSVIATGNLPDEGAFSLPVSHALTNRCMVYQVGCAFEPWQDWAREANVNALIVGFLSKNQDFLLQDPPAGDDTAYCHPSPRAWTLAARQLDATMEDKTPVEIQTQIVAGYVGNAAAVKFQVWLEHYRHIEPIINALVREGKHPDTSNMDVARIMVTSLSGVNAITALCKATPTKKDDKEKQRKRIHKVTKNVFGWLQTVSEEFAIGAVKSGLSMKIIQDHELVKVQELMATYLKIRRALND